MDLSVKAKERFCKDCNIPLRLFQEPYFTDRMKLYDRFYNTLSKWDLFVSEIQKYHCEQDYYEEYNCVKDEAILSIKNSEAYDNFNNEDMNKFRVKNVNLPSNDIFKVSNDGKQFLSIDMRKANFSSLYNYSDKMFSGANTWEEFISKFTDNKHIINSKYIRQVILGNCNPKRHITYEKYIMDDLLDFVVKFFIPISKIVFFSNDEIVFDVTNMDYKSNSIEIQSILDVKGTVPFKVELFTLNKINGTDGYYKDVFNPDGNEIEFKCLDNYMLPFVIRKFSNEDITESDKVFYHEGLLSKFIEVPNIVI